MHIEEFRDYCLAKEDVEESTPFGPDVLVFKVKGKMFALYYIDEFKRINLKCEPARAIELREEFEEITPAYHMNKEHWNSLSPQGSLSNSMIFQLVDDSYDLILASMKKKK